MLSKAIALSLLIGFTLGFMSYWACRVGYKAVLEVLEEKSTKKEPLAYTGKVD